MANKKLSINDVLNDTKAEIQSFKNADKKAEILKKAEAEKKEIGRPSVSEADKKKKRTLYYSDSEYEKIEKIAKLYGLKPMKYIKMIIAKELRREGIEL